jgi:hypothetical protein
MTTRSSFLCCLVFLAFLAFSCSSYIYERANPALVDGKYDSEFPYRASSEVLGQISESIRTINCIGTYKTYSFDELEKVVRSDVGAQLLQTKASTAFFSDKSVRGTATVIANDGSRIAFLTCAHVVDFPDTVVAYYPGPDGKPTPIIRTVSVKIKQFNFVSPMPEGGNVDTVFLDVNDDIAVLGTFLRTQNPQAIPELHFGLGKAKELEWGTFVYVFTFQAGIKMVTKAIVSSPRKEPDNSFYIDAVLSGGSSGGVALAIRDGIPNFEVVGLVRVVPARFSYYLAPKDTGEEPYDLDSPYTGDIFIQKRTDLEMGVTKCISAETIRKTLEEHKEAMLNQGYDCSRFLRSRRQE